MNLKYEGEAGRYYPKYGITPEPGKTYDLPDDPADGLWAEVKGAKTTADPATKEA